MEWNTWNTWNMVKAGPRKGMPRTFTDRIIRYLVEGDGLKEMVSYSLKYRRFSGNVEGTFYFVGKNGAVRRGKNASSSVSISDFINHRMELWELRNKK